MALSNTRHSYGSLSKLFHWLTALVVFAMLGLGYYHDALQNVWPHTHWMRVHKLLGLSLLLLMVLRLVWRMGNPWPAMPRNVPDWESKLAHGVFYVFYLILFLMPLAGWIMSTAAGRPPVLWRIGALSFPGIPLNPRIAQTAFQVHATTAVILMVLIGLHALGALKNHFFAQNNLLKRMLPFYKAPSKKPRSQNPLDDFMKQP